MLLILIPSNITILFTSLPSMGSTSVTEPASAAAASSTESLNGLKFGQKIYFEDVGVGAPAKAAKKGRGYGVQGAQPPRCQVEGCRVDLSDAKAYYSRHKVCSMHSKSPKVVVAGQEQRFCQQCSRFHQLSEFDQVKRSCRRRLAGHNERRRKPPPSSLLASRYGRLGAPNFDSNSRGGGGGFVMEFATFPKLSLRNAMGSPTSCEQVGGGGNPVPWQGNCESPSLVLLEAGGGGTSLRNSCSGESFAGGMTDSSCALSLLSNQAWAPRNHRAPSLGINNFMTFDDTTQLAAPPPPSSHHHHLSNATSSWCFKGVDSGGNDLGLGHHMNSPLPGEIDVSQQGRRHYMDLEHSRPYDDSHHHHMHWSL